MASAVASSTTKLADDALLWRVDLMLLIRAAEEVRRVAVVAEASRTLPQNNRRLAVVTSPVITASEERKNCIDLDLVLATLLSVYSSLHACHDVAEFVRSDEYDCHVVIGKGADQDGKEVWFTHGNRLHAYIAFYMYARFKQLRYPEDSIHVEAVKRRITTCEEICDVIFKIFGEYTRLADAYKEFHRIKGTTPDLFVLDRTFGIFKRSNYAPEWARTMFNADLKEWRKRRAEA